MEGKKEKTADSRGAQYSEVYKNTEMHVCIQLAKDLLQEYCNMEQARDARYETRMAFGAFNQLRKKMSRAVGRETLEKFEDVVAEMADDISPTIEYGKSMLRTILVNRMPYQQIEAGVLFGMMGGFLSAAAERYAELFGVQSTDIGSAYRYMKMAEGRLHFTTLNEGQKVDFAACREAMAKVREKVRNTIEASM